jgi:hypothetical protein
MLVMLQSVLIGSPSHKTSNCTRGYESSNQLAVDCCPLLALSIQLDCLDCLPSVVVFRRFHLQCHPSLLKVRYNGKRHVRMTNHAETVVDTPFGMSCNCRQYTLYSGNNVHIFRTISFSLMHRPNSGLGCLIVEFSNSRTHRSARAHTHTHTPVVPPSRGHPDQCQCLLSL